MSHHPKNKQHNYMYGAISGFLTVFITQPFQVIRTSMMVTYLDHKPSGLFHIIKRLHREEGLPGFYRGIIPTLIKTPIATGLYFAMLEKNKTLLNNSQGNTTLKNFTASGIARTVQCIISNPILLIITRFEVIGFNKYETFMHAFKHIYRDEGLKGYTKGLNALLIKEVPTAAMFYSLYEAFKLGLGNAGVNNIQLQATISAVTANVILTFLNNPIDVIRTRIQYHHFSQFDHHNYKGVFSGIYNIAKTEGMSGLFVGVVPRMMKRAAGSAIAWTTFETLKRLDI
jgi:hypothetical protein